MSAEWRAPQNKYITNKKQHLTVFCRQSYYMDQSPVFTKTLKLAIYIYPHTYIYYIYIYIYILYIYIYILYIYIYIYIYYIYIYIYTYINRNTIKQNVQNDGKWKQSSAIKQPLETLFLTTKMYTDFTTDVIWMNAMCAVSLVSRLRTVADAFRPLRTHQCYWTTEG